MPCSCDCHTIFAFSYFHGGVKYMNKHFIQDFQVFTRFALDVSFLYQTISNLCQEDVNCHKTFAVFNTEVMSNNSFNNYYQYPDRKYQPIFLKISTEISSEVKYLCSNISQNFLMAVHLINGPQYVCKQTHVGTYSQGKSSYIMLKFLRNNFTNPRNHLFQSYNTIKSRKIFEISKNISKYPYDQTEMVFVEQIHQPSCVS